MFGFFGNQGLSLGLQKCADEAGLGVSLITVFFCGNYARQGVS